MKLSCLLEDSNGMLYIGYSTMKEDCITFASVLLILDDTLKQLKEYLLDGSINHLSACY